MVKFPFYQGNRAMLLKKLNHFVFSDFKTLSEEDIEQAIVFFKPFMQTPNFQAALIELKAIELHDCLFKEKDSVGYYHVRENESLRSYFNILNESHHYFKEKELNTVFIIYQQLCQLLELHRLLTNANTDIYLPRLCYKLLVFFAHDDIQTLLQSLDLYFSNTEQTIYSLSNYQLNKNPNNHAIDLPAWQALILAEGVEPMTQLLNLAPEIEKALGQAPITLAEAIEGVKKRRFSQQNENKEFASFCLNNLIEEKLFAECLTLKEKNNDIDSLLKIIKQLPPALYSQFIEVMPTFTPTGHQLHNLLEALPGYESQLLTHFSHQLSKMSLESFSLSALLTFLPTSSLQKELMSYLGKEVIQSVFKKDSYFFFPKVVSTIQEDFQHEFLTDFIGLEALRNYLLQKSNLQMKDFLEHALPKCQQIAFIKNTVGIETARATIESHVHIRDQLEHINAQERLKYIEEIIGADTLNKTIETNWCMLCAVLKVIPQEQRLSLLFDIMGADCVRQTVSLWGDLRARDDVMALLAPQDHDLFLNKLATREEKVAKHLVTRSNCFISTCTFPTGWGGVSITLDDQSKKTVPENIAKQWGYIKAAQRLEMSYTCAWQEIEKLAREVKSKSNTLNNFFRSKEAKEYYKSVATAKDQVKGMNPSYT